MPKLSESTRQEIVQLRKQGYSIPEISRQLNVAKTTVQRHVLGVRIPQQYLQRLKERQGGSKDRATGLRENTLAHVKGLLGSLTERDLLMILIGLYWGEGTKRDFGIINSDPHLIQAFIVCLGSIGIPKERLSVSLRVHKEISVESAKKFWSEVTGLSINTIGRIEIIEGKKKGKLKFGMCRIRVRSGIRERLLIQTAIKLIGNESDKKLLSISGSRSSMDRTEVS